MGRCEERKGKWNGRDGGMVVFELVCGGFSSAAGYFFCCNDLSGQSFSQEPDGVLFLLMVGRPFASAASAAMTAANGRLVVLALQSLIWAETNILAVAALCLGMGHV